MAKVINQDIPAQEVLYDPDPARPNTLGQAYQQAMTEGHGGNVTGGALIVGKSPISGRPPQRGPGSTAQQPQRDCFKCCAEMWRNSPQYFKACVKDVYNDRPSPAKDRQIPPEWFSTPYSTFQALCLKKCRAVGSCEFSIFDLLICPPTACLGATIGYTTNGMNINENQQLTIINPQPGMTYIFQIESGGGTITEEGQYTSPASNENCDQNATIGLICQGQVVDILEIAINGYMDLVIACQGGEEAKSNGCFPDQNCPGPNCQCPDPDCMVENCQFTKINYHCDGSIYSEQTIPGQVSYCVGPEGTCQALQTSIDCKNIPHTFSEWDGNIYDCRTESHIAQGCCPPQLL